jgi:lipopolysaccharide/colanic/teichoic acid biosynthesis glycosyltransferase
VFQNVEDAAFFVAHGITPAGRVRVVPGSGVRTDVFDPGRVPAADRQRRRRELGIGPAEIVVTMVSRVIRSKGVPEFGAAAARVRGGHPAVRFLLVGPDDPDSRDRLTAGELRTLRDRVTWPGPTADVRVVLAITDVFVLPSAYREGVPRVLLEAAAMALPIVTTAMPGCSAVVEEGANGFLVPTGDTAALAVAVSRLVASPGLRARFGAASRQRAVERFDLQVVAAQMRALYGEALAEGGTRPVGRAGAPAGTRALDICLAGLGLLLTWPLILLGAVAVKLTSPGPALYRARRAGVHGHSFDMLKLRTMRVGGDAPDRRITAVRDPRVTPVGRVLRRLKVDELPQLWNVLRGDMSVVGPRPEACDIVARHYTPEQRRVLAARPGIASPVDIDWYPDLTYHDPPPPGVPIQEHYLRRHMPLQVAEALRYLERRTVLTDLAVIARAAACILLRAWRLPPRRSLPSAPAARTGARDVGSPAAGTAGGAVQEQRS